MMKASKQHFCSKLCSNLSTFLPIILLVILLSSSFFSTSKSLPFLLTIPIAFISTLFLVTLRKKKGSQNESIVQEKLQKKELQLQPLLDVTETEFNQQSETVENHEQQAEAQSDYSFPSDSECSSYSFMDKTFELNVQEFKPQAYLQSDSSLPSDSESSTDSIMGESFEINHNEYQNVNSFDSLASNTDDDGGGGGGGDDDGDEDDEEEDGLIEINLPSCHFFDLTEESKQKLGSKLPDFLPESIFKKQDLLELLAEINDMNEDENLIEIDISMGSTNSQDFRLKQELAYLGNQCLSD